MKGQKTVCLMANSKNADVMGARIMRSIRALSSSEINFFGYGGKWMEKESGFKSEMDLDNFVHKDFVTYRKSVNSEEDMYYRYSRFNFINAHFLRTGDNVMQKLNEAQYAKRIFQGRPSVILSIDNEYLAWQLFSQIDSYYSESALPKPQRQFVGKLVRDYKQWVTKYVDYLHYTLPMAQASRNYYEFPSQYIGQNGVYRAIHHLYEQGGRKDLLRDNSLFVNRSRFGLQIERLRSQARIRFRQELEIPEDAFVIFVAPGNDREEVEFCINNLRKGVKEFLHKYSAPTSLSPIAAPIDKFVTIMSLHKGSDGEAVALQYLKQTEWTGSLKIVSSDDDHTYVDAMVASDAGFIYDGDLVGAAAVTHLPIAILIKMRMHHQWYHDLFNRWWNSMNIIANNNIYPEFIGGEAWFGKMCDTLAEWYLKPGARFDQARKWEGFLKEAMAYKKIDRSEYHSGRDIVLKGETYDEFYDPDYLLASKIVESIEGYKDPFEAQKVDAYEISAVVPNIY